LKFVLPVVALHLVLALCLGFTLNIWADESCSLATTRGNLGFAVHQSVNFEWQPPGYFVILWIWRQISDSIFWARALSAFCTALTVILFFFRSRRLASEYAIWPYLATIVLAFHPYTVFAALELRLYGMGLLLSVVQFDLFWRSYIGFTPAGRQLTATSIAKTNRPLKSVRHGFAVPDGFQRKSCI